MAVSISSLTSSFKDEQKSINVGELDAGVVLTASMRDTVYQVSVSQQRLSESTARKGNGRQYVVPVSLKLASIQFEDT